MTSRPVQWRFHEAYIKIRSYCTALEDFRKVQGQSREVGMQTTSFGIVQRQATVNSSQLDCTELNIIVVLHFFNPEDASQQMLEATNVLGILHVLSCVS